ncbi:hypothetical protein D5086_029744 [Populus alba]|uniref:Uncharacterized protein n=1 Tax=Populus alba TaxID=43335 RepID=A0ACC4AV38_POPAL
MATGKEPGNPVPAMRTYPPVEHPVVVIGPQYLAQYPVELFVNSYFKVSDINGTLIFQVNSKLLSLHDRSFLKDAAGNTYVNLRQKVHRRHTLAIMPNVDYAFIVALVVVILDEIKADGYSDAAINVAATGTTDGGWETRWQLL